MTKKIDPVKTPPPELDDLGRELVEITGRIQALIMARPQDAKKIVYGFLGHAIAYADGIGIDPIAFVHELRAIYVKPVPMVFVGSKGGSS